MAKRIVIVDDEPDIHAITRMSLKKMLFEGQSLDLVFFDNAQDAISDLAAHPETALVLMDVVMETDTAGLDAVKSIREAQQNKLTRILLRTGQPGSVPETEVIQNYDIDGYMSKTELTQARLFTSVRASLKAHAELSELQDYRTNLTYLNLALLNLHATRTLSECLEELTQIVSALANSELTVMYLRHYKSEGTVPHIFFNGPESMSDDELHEKTAEIVMKIESQVERIADDEASSFEGGWITPVKVPQNGGSGLIYVQLIEPTALQQQMLDMLSSHAGVALSLMPEQPPESPTRTTRRNIEF